MKEDKTIQKFVKTVHEISQKKSDKEYIEGLMKLFDEYVKKYSNEISATGDGNPWGAQRDPEVVEELDR